MKKLFRPRNLLILAVLGVVVGVAISKKNSAPAPSYPDPWATPSPESDDGEAQQPLANAAP